MIILEMQNHLIRRVDARTRIITTLAGDGVAGDRGDGGPAKDARFSIPHCIAIDAKDNIYVSDLGNHCVRRIDAASGRIETIVGTGEESLPSEGGSARSEPFLTPQGVEVDGDNLWIASVSGHSLWRLDLQRGTIHRVAGDGQRGYTGDGGDPLAATFDGPRGIGISPEGIVYVTEGENNIVRAIAPQQHAIWTVAGVGADRSVFDADRIPATKAAIGQPHAVCVCGDTLIVSDTLNHRVRLLRPLNRDAH
jgi:hypothetical protein